MTTTPRTDAFAECPEVFDSNGQPYTMMEIVPSEIARQLETELANYASAAEELRREVNELRAELARIQGQTRWQCTCGGTDCEGQKENEEQARLLDMSATREAKHLAMLDRLQCDLIRRDRLLGLIRSYPYIPQGLAALIDKEVAGWGGKG